MHRAGMFIAFEGIDKCGKRTLLERVAAQLVQEGQRVVTGSEPNDAGSIGCVIRDMLQGRRPMPPSSLELQRLFVLDRATDLVCTILPALTEGAAVLWERFHLSTFAYGEAGYEALRDLHAVVAGSFLRLPDVTFLLDVSPEESLRRLHVQQEEPQYFETQERLARARARYLELARRPDLVGRVAVLNAERTPEEVFVSCWHHLSSLLTEAASDRQ